MTCMCVLHFGTSAKQQREINKNAKYYGEHRHSCVFSFLYLNLSTVFIDSLMFNIFFRVNFSLAFLTGSNAIFLAGKQQRLMSLLISNSVDYCLDDCFASCENIVWISIKRMYGKLSPPPPPPPLLVNNYSLKWRPCEYITIIYQRQSKYW